MREIIKQRENSKYRVYESAIEFIVSSRAIEFSNSHPFNTDIFFPLCAKENSLIL